LPVEEKVVINKIIMNTQTINIRVISNTTGESMLTTMVTNCFVLHEFKKILETNLPDDYTYEIVGEFEEKTAIKQIMSEIQLCEN